MHTHNATLHLTCCLALPCLTLPHLTSSYLSSPYLILPFLNVPSLPLPYLPLLYITAIYFIFASHDITSHYTTPYLRVFIMSVAAESVPTNIYMYKHFHCCHYFCHSYQIGICVLCWFWNWCACVCVCVCVCVYLLLCLRSKMMSKHTIYYEIIYTSTIQETQTQRPFLLENEQRVWSMLSPVAVSLISGSGSPDWCWKYQRMSSSRLRLEASCRPNRRPGLRRLRFWPAQSPGLAY